MLVPRTQPYALRIETETVLSGATIMHLHPILYIDRLGAITVVQSDTTCLIYLNWAWMFSLSKPKSKVLFLIQMVSINIGFWRKAKYLILSLSVSEFVFQDMFKIW